MRKLLIIPIFLICTTVFSQGFSKDEIRRLEKVLKRSNSAIRDFDQNSLISVERTGNEELEGLIENALFVNGFEVVSNKVARESINISNPLNTENKNIEITSTQSFKTVYVVTVSGQYYSGAIIGKCQKSLLTFSARIIDLSNEGKLVGTFSFTGNAMTYVACETDVANAFSYKLYKK